MSINPFSPITDQLMAKDQQPNGLAPWISNSPSPGSLPATKADIEALRAEIAALRNELRSLSPPHPQSNREDSQ